MARRRSAAATVALAGACLVACGPTAEVAPRPDFTGVWSGYLTTDSHPYWQFDDLPCFPGCAVEFRKRLDAAFAAAAGGPPPNTRTLLDDYYPTIMTADGLARLAQAPAAQSDLASFCEPYGLLREAMNPLPFRIHDEGERLIFEYEEWSLTRTIHLNGAGRAPAEKTPLGHSVGRFDGATLVVDSTGFTGDYYPGRTGSYSDSATIQERYVMHEEPRRLVLELTIEDPVTLKAPFVWTKTWLYTPEIELLKDSCEDVPGVF